LLPAALAGLKKAEETLVRGFFCLFYMQLRKMRLKKNLAGGTTRLNAIC
jgi:hypothetical protein